MPEKFFLSLSLPSIEAAIFLNLSPEDKTWHHNRWLFQLSPASMLNNLVVPGSRSKIEDTEQRMEPKCLWCLGQVQVSRWLWQVSSARYTGTRNKCIYMWMWLDRAKWHLKCMPEKFFLSLSLLSTEPAILPRKNLMFLESQTSHWANMDPKTGCNKMRSAERYQPSLGLQGWWLALGPVLGSIPMAFKCHGKIFSNWEC